MGKLDKEQLNRLTSLLKIISPSMQEANMTDYLQHQWSGVCQAGKARRDAMGNLEFSIIRNESYPTIALVSHSDTVCVQITCKQCAGQYRFRSVGLSPHTLLGQKVVLVNEEGKEIDGVVGFDATSQYGQPKGLVFEDLWIDIPADNDNEITPGDLAVLRPSVSISESTVTASGLDDRVGLFIIGEILKHFNDTFGDVPVNLICVATVQEEVGLRGSGMFKFSRTPDAVIVLDVDYATDIPTPHREQLGDLHLHKGPGVQRKADNNPRVRQMIKDAAIRLGKPLQVSPGRFLYGGTDGTQLQMSRVDDGYAVANVTIPCRYMHSPAETVSLSDAADAISILCNVIENFSRE